MPGIKKLENGTYYICVNNKPTKRGRVQKKKGKTTFWVHHSFDPDVNYGEVRISQHSSIFFPPEFLGKRVRFKVEVLSPDMDEAGR